MHYCFSISFIVWLSYSNIQYIINSISCQTHSVLAIIFPAAGTIASYLCLAMFTATGRTKCVFMFQLPDKQCPGYYYGDHRNSVCRSCSYASGGQNNSLLAMFMVIELISPAFFFCNVVTKLQCNKLFHIWSYQ